MTAVINEGDWYSYDKELDATGLECPLPILRSKKALNTMESGQILYVISTDPGSVRDFKVFCRHTGHNLIDSVEEQERFLFLIKKR